MDFVVGHDIFIGVEKRIHNLARPHYSQHMEAIFFSLNKIPDDNHALSSCSCTLMGRHCQMQDNTFLKAMHFSSGKHFFLHRLL